MNLFKDEALEAAAHAAIRLDEPRALLDRFVTLIRESGGTQTKSFWPASRVAWLSPPRV